MSEPLFHIVAPGGWPAAGWYRPPSLSSEGFVHLSFVDQVTGSANKHYPAAPQLVVIELDPSALPGELRVEDSYGTGTAYPHLYGPVPVAAVIAVHPLRRAPDGSWEFTPDTGAAAPASPDR